MISTGSAHEKSRKKRRGSGDKGGTWDKDLLESGAGPASTARWEVETVPNCCTKEVRLLPYPYFQLPPARSGIALRVSMGMVSANKTYWSCWESPLCLLCTWSQPCSSCTRDKKVGCFLTYPFLAERGVVQQYQFLQNPLRPPEEQAACV